ncbi:hypothetical protein E2562_033667 [Oryza meyeriana var. granulata]|uniref:Uncharacterized protein n=1 Tax=Oryza meyeriana var. granulata TaxID=110450 RepID=A0A6G1CAJ2_9ORYZ|nr:hypothetical protein E2562_033667 [Oryza meyeriana var. granulata]
MKEGKDVGAAWKMLRKGGDSGDWGWGIRGEEGAASATGARSMPPRTPRPILASPPAVPTWCRGRPTYSHTNMPLRRPCPVLGLGRIGLTCPFVSASEAK